MAGPAVKQQRRKASTLTKSKVTTPQKHASSSISSFARVSKTTTTHTDIKKELTTTPIKKTALEPLTPASRKRKVIATVEEDDLSADETPKKLSLPPAKLGKAVAQSAKRGPGRPAKKSRPEPAPKKRARSPSVSDSDESTINAGSLFKRLRLESSPSRCSSPLTAETSLTDYSEADADNEITPTKKTHRPLPTEVLDLIDLHSALLKTLTLHYAHNGSNVPADLRVLCPNVARAWGKKKVTDADIRICLGVLNQTSTSPYNNKAFTQAKATPLFSLSNYGRGKVCIEIDSTQHSGGRPLNEKKLNDEFRANLTLLWTQFAAQNDANDASAFTSTLPKAPVSLCASLAKAAPVLSKGQKRLEELKHGIAAKKEATAAAKSAVVAKKPQSTSSNNATNTNDTPMTNADGSKMSLLDRIRLKSLQKASAAATNLTPAQLERRAALQRASEVAAVLGMLGRAQGNGCGGRVSFTMAAVLEKLKDSFREGISREEGAACVRLLAGDVAPDWIRVVVVGGRENVVVETDRQLGRADIEGRVRAVLERE
ncbi:multiprotein-bridging factor 1 [Hypoxylon texense]